MTEQKPTIASDEARLWQPDFVYSTALFIAAVAVVSLQLADAGLLAGEHGWGMAGFLLLFGLFTITTGFPHPVFGHVSFDRVAQVLSILIVGPVDAAWIVGLTSFLYPWHRLWRGVPLRQVVLAAFHNAGLMTFVVLGAGLLYRYLGGVFPPVTLDLGTGVLLFVLVFSMQAINDIGMMLILWLRRGDPRDVFNVFALAVEYVAAATGIVLAMTLVTQSLSFFILLLLVFVAGMLVIMQYALMRYRLEKLVEDRTEELRVQAKEFERQATHDKLTGLPNRRHADRYLQQQIDLAMRNDSQGALALADIDHFKRINDNHSHAIGDEVLERVAGLLHEGCRKTDFVARYGGEEFLLYFPDTSSGRAREVCEQLRVAVQDTDWSNIAPRLNVTLSFGLAAIRDSDHSTTVLSQADMRLYRAKNDGRNRVVAA
jgi:diguanylate cyclase (GGDEF)-like protein